MNERRSPDVEALRRECLVFGRYLAEVVPGSDVTAAYVRAHELGVIDPPRGSSRFDRWLAAFAGGGPVRVRLADAYAALLLRRGLLRRKLILLLALLETSAPEHRRVLDAPPGSVSGSLFRMLLAGGASALLFLAAVLVLGACRLAGRGGVEDARGPQP